MKLKLHGGVGEKGRTCIGVEHDGVRILLDAGVNTSVARGPDYYPAIASDELAETDALIITHAHEDHVAALGWCLTHGFKGQVVMTTESHAESDSTLADYASSEERAIAQATPATFIRPGDQMTIGPFSLGFGRSGHVVGGVWCHIAVGDSSVLYCGDVVPASPVFAMDPLPSCDLVLVDASYGDDRVAAAERGDAVKQWLARHPRGAVMPTPLSGRSLELLALIEGPIAIPSAMRAPLTAQIGASDWLTPEAARHLSDQLATAIVWDEHMPLPQATLLCHDGMGMAGPSAVALQIAERAHHPVLLTGHLPKGSPAALMHEAGNADWLRLPTHPTIFENRAMIEACGAPQILAHSCDPNALRAMAKIIPALAVDVRTGDEIEVTPRRT